MKIRFDFGKGKYNRFYEYIEADSYFELVNKIYRAVLPYYHKGVPFVDSFLMYWTEKVIEIQDGDEELKPENAEKLFNELRHYDEFSVEFFDEED